MGVIVNELEVHVEPPAAAAEKAPDRQREEPVEELSASAVAEVERHLRERAERLRAH